MSRKYQQNEYILKQQAKSKSTLIVEDDKAKNGLLHRGNLHKYFDDTTLHGLRYIGDHTITLFERFVYMQNYFSINLLMKVIRSLIHIHRLFFLCVFVAATSLSLYTIWIFWTQWSSNTILTLNSFRSPFVELPFPAVTICNTNFVQKSAVQKFKPTSEEGSIIRDICHYDSAQINTTTTWQRMRQVLREVSSFTLYVYAGN